MLFAAVVFLIGGILGLGLLLTFIFIVIGILANLFSAFLVEVTSSEKDDDGFF